MLFPWFLNSHVLTIKCDVFPSSDINLKVLGSVSDLLSLSAWE